MSKVTGYFIIILVCIFAFTAYCDEAVSSKDLIEKANALDGKFVTYRGEAVTAILDRGEHSWVNLNDGDNAIGVWCNSAMLKDVRFIGDYKSKGDILEVSGIFNRACDLHKGELDIHADSIRITKHGFPVGRRLDKIKTDLAATLFLLTIAVVALFRRRI